MKFVTCLRAYVTSRDKRSNEVLLSSAELNWAQWWSHRGEVIFFVLMGVIFTFAPPGWFGPTWSYFKYLPHGGFGIGVACFGLGVLLITAIWLRSKMLISIVLMLGSIAFWVAAFLIAAEGISSGTGLMEAPFMIYASVDMLIRSAVARR